MAEITDRVQPEAGAAYSSSSEAGIAPEAVGATVDIVSRDWHGTDGALGDDLSPGTHKTRPQARTLTQPQTEPYFDPARREG